MQYRSTSAVVALSFVLSPAWPVEADPSHWTNWLPGEQVDVTSLAPFYCPPVNPEKRACIRGHLFYAPNYIEEFLAGASVKVLQRLNEETTVSSNWSAPAQALLELIEAVRLFWCFERYRKCYEPRDVIQAQRELCIIAGDKQFQLGRFGGEKESSCLLLYRDLNAWHLAKAISLPLHGLVQQAWPKTSPPALGNDGSRFDFEHFWQAVSAVEAFTGPFIPRPAVHERKRHRVKRICQALLM